MTSSFKANFHGIEREFSFLVTSYDSNDNTAVLLVEDNGEPYATATVNFDFLCPGCAYVDDNNLPGIGKLLQKNDFAKPLGAKRHSGFVDYSLYEFDLEAMKDYILPSSDYFMVQFSA